MRVGALARVGGRRLFLRENPRAGVGRRRRLSPMELQLPQLRRLRAGTFRGQARTQSSIAVCGADAASWVLVNASPDIRAIAGHPRLAAEPRAARHRARRHHPGRRPGGPHHRTLHVARIDPPVAHLVHRQHLCRSDPRQSRSACWRILRRRSAPHRSRRRLDFASMPVPGVRWRRCRWRASPRRIRRTANRPSRATTGADHRGRGQRPLGVCAGTGAIDERAVGAPCSAPPACWWTARSGPTMK
jgi:hypothetical protein